MPDVYYVFVLKHNLMSTGQLLQKGYIIYMEDNHCVIMDRYPSNQHIARVYMRSNKMFPLTMKPAKKKNIVQDFGKEKYMQLDIAFIAGSVRSSEEGKSSACNTKKEEDSSVEMHEAFQSKMKYDSWLWNFRFGHLNFGGLNVVHTKDMVKSFPLIEKKEITCEGCIFGKQHRESSWKVIQSKRSTENFTFRHLWTMQTPSIGGSIYFLTFIDNFSRKTWIYFLKHKSDALGYFQQFKSLVEKKSGYYIKVLRTESGGEYVSRKFNNFFKFHGIYKQFIARYTPQQNGAAERKNRTIMEMVRSMLATQHLSIEYLVEAVSNSVYIMNRCLTKNVKNNVPQESWTGMKHNVVHLKVFGFVAYAHVSDELRKKIDNKGQKCIFVGYSEDVKII
jgi:hypothetical protein